MKNFLFIILMSIFALSTSTAQNGKYTAGVFSSGVNCETGKAYFDIKIKATDANSHFKIADANFRFAVERSAFVPQSVFIESELDLAGPIQGEDGTYSIYAHTTTGSLDTIVSYNVSLSGGTGYTITDEAWTSVGRIGLDIADTNACTFLAFNDATVFPPTYVSELFNGLHFSIRNPIYENLNICLSDYCSGVSSCLPNGITFNTQKQIDDFAVDYPGCTEITGGVIIEETASGNILNLDGLSQLTAIGGNLEIKNNAALASLYGLENVNALSGNLIIENNTTLYDINSLASVDDTKITDLQITNNTSLAVCHIKNICNYLSNDGSNKIAGNATGCDDAVAVSNACSTNACTLIDVKFTSQQQIDNFATNYPNCTQISGDIIIDDVVATPITNLKGLSQLVSVGGTLNIRNNISLSNLSGLDNITTIGNLLIERNASLVDMSGLDKLTTISNIDILNNDMLHNLAGLNGLTSVSGDINIEYNNILSNMTGLHYLETVGGDLVISNNFIDYGPGLKNVRMNNLMTVGGNLEISRSRPLLYIELKKLESVGNNFKINSHNLLRSFDANNLKTIGGDFYFGNTYALKDFSGLTRLNSVGGNFTIETNHGLNTLSDLSNLQSISGKLDIHYNNIGSLNGLDNIDPAGISSLKITTNLSLSVCGMTNICTYLASGKPTEIHSNSIGCSTEAQVKAICTSDKTCDYNSTISLFSDDDIYIDSKGFDNNPTMTFALPTTTSEVTFSDVSLKLYFRLSGNSCEDDIAIQITDPAGNTHPLKAYTTCDGGTGLRQITLDVPNSTAIANAGNWTVQFDDTNDQNSGNEYSVRYGKLTYNMEGSDGVTIPVQEGIAENEGKDIDIRSGGFSNNPSIELVATPPNNATTVSTVSLEIFFKVFGSSCESDIATQVTTPEGYTFPVTGLSTCQGAQIYKVQFDIPSTYFTDISGIWLLEFDDTNPQNQTVEYAVKHVRLRYIAEYVTCINALIDSNKNLNGNALTDSNMKKQTLSLDEDIRLYPVPTGQYLNIDYLSESEYPLDIEVVSNDGKTLMTHEALVQEGVNTLQLNVHQLPAGHYYLKMYSADKAPQMKSFVKVNQK